MTVPWGLLALAAVAASLGAGATLAWPRLDRSARSSLVAATVLATPIAFAGVLTTYRTLLARHGIANAGDVALLLLAPIAGVAVLAVFAGRAPWRGAWWLLVALPLAIFLAFGPSPMYRTDASLDHLRFAFAALAAAAVFPHAVARALARPVVKKRFLPGAAAALTLALLFPISLTSAIAPLTEGGAFTQASHSWRASLHPSDPTASYEALVPFLGADTQRSRAGLEGLERSLRIVEGTGAVTLDHEKGLVRIVAQGPISLAAEHVFYGSIGARESFNDYRVRDLEATLVRAEPSATVRLAWSVDLGGGGGHTCWASATHEVDLRVDEPTPITRDERAWQGVCA